MKKLRFIPVDRSTDLDSPRNQSMSFFSVLPLSLSLSSIARLYLSSFLP